jgi:cyclohexa-1,5-dienecarbonyl-CoA hydratase
VVSLHRPPLNVLDVEAIRALHAALAPLPARRDLKVLVLRSDLDRAFSAGVDVRDHSRERAPEMLDAFHAVFRLMDALPQATLAAARKALRHAEGGFDRALAGAERIYREELLPSEDVEEGIRAFLEKRAPRWRDG